MDFADKAGVLGQLWIEFREDEDFAAFIEYNDLGLPMAYMVAEGLVKELSPLGEEMINETLAMLLDVLNISESEIDTLDTKNLEEVLKFAYTKRQANPPTE